MAGRSYKQHFLYWLITAAGIYALLPFLLIARYNQPSADDYFGAVRDGNKGFLSVFTDTYMHWSGRYFATVVARINPLLYHSPSAYKWYAVVLLAAFATSLILLVRALTANYFSWGQSLALSCLVLFLYLAVLPGTAEGFYWFSGAYVYQTANVFFMLLMAILVKLQQQTGRWHKPVYFIIAMMLAVCITGCNEISLMITCGAVIFFAVNKYRLRKKHDALLTSLAVIVVVAGCVAIFAPGNFERMNGLQEFSKSPLWTVAGAAGITVIYFTQWAVPLLVATVVYVPLFGNPLAEKIAVAQIKMPVKFIHSFIFFIVLFLLLQLFTVWVAGGSNLGRIENVIYLYLLLGWFFNMQLFINEYLQGKRALSFFSKPYKTVLVLLFLMSVFDINNNISTGYISLLTGNAKKYSDELEGRAALAKQCNADTCYVPPLTVLPNTIFFTDIKCTTDSLDFWMNKAYSAYYGSGYVLVTAPLPHTKTNMEAIEDFGKEMREQVFKSGR